MLDKACHRRAIKLEATRREKLEDLKLWLAISNLRNVPHSMLLLTRINDYANEMFSINENETREEVLRRVSILKITNFLVKKRRLLLGVSPNIREGFWCGKD